MQFCCRLFAVVFLSLSALASELTVKVVDPRSGAVSGAQVEIFSEKSTRPAPFKPHPRKASPNFAMWQLAISRVHVSRAGIRRAMAILNRETADNASVGRYGHCIWR